MFKADTQTIVAALHDLATHLSRCNEKAQILVLAAAQRLETAEANVTRLNDERTKAIRALMAAECPLGGPSCPMEMGHLDEQFIDPTDRMGFRCVHKDFDGECPFEKKGGAAALTDVYGCWAAWLGDRERG